MPTKTNEPVMKIKDQNKHWYLNGKLHREDGPAIITYDGIKYWYLNGKKHREGGPAVETDSGSYQAWYVNGKRHRVDGPSKLNNGRPQWHLNGKKFPNEAKWKEALLAELVTQAS